MLAQRRINPDQKRAGVFQTQIDEPGIGPYVSTENFQSENVF